MRKKNRMGNDSLMGNQNMAAARRTHKKRCNRALYALCAAAVVMAGAAGCGKETGQNGENEPGGAGITGSANPTVGGTGDDTVPTVGGTGNGTVPTVGGSLEGDQNPAGTGSPEGDFPTPGANGEGDAADRKNLVLFGTADEILACFREQTSGYALAMLSEDFSVCSAFSEELSSQLSERDMKNAWKQAVAGLKNPLAADGQETEHPQKADVATEASFLNSPASGSVSGSIADFGGYVITSAQIPYEQKNVILSITYGQTGMVDGIYLTYTLPAAKPEVTEAYTEREVKVGEGEYPLEGILTLPNGVENPPVVLLVHGSGQSDKNETIGAAGNAPFADIAHGLAKHGIATLRYDKRYYAYPGLATQSITIRDEVLDDVAAAIALLSATKEVDGERIFVLGHSLGGMLAPCIVQENPQVAGMISLAGSPRGLWEIVYDQNIAAMQAAGLSESEFAELAAMVQQEYDTVLSLVADVRGKTGGISEDTLSAVLFGVSGYYWASLAKIDTAAIAKELAVPMLILQGGADFQVYPERDYAAWQVLLEGKENVTFRLFEGLNHLFMPSSGAMDITEYDEEAHVAEDVIAVIATWLGESGS